jgi:ABC-type branched-subunit amino acid transport system substrate-binding protein
MQWANQLRPSDQSEHDHGLNGALSFTGIANANLAKMVTDDINASGGLLGRTIEAIPRGQREPQTASRKPRQRSSSGKITST